MEKASRAWQRSFRAVQRPRAHRAEPADRLRFHTRDGLCIWPATSLGADEIEEEGRRAARAPACRRSFSRTRDLGGMTGMDREAALLSEGAAEVNPVQLTAGLLDRALSRGSRLFAPVQLAEVVPSSGKVAMFTSDGVETGGQGARIRHRIRAGRRRVGSWTPAHEHVGVRNAAAAKAHLGQRRADLGGLEPLPLHPHAPVTAAWWSAVRTRISTTRRRAMPSCRAKIEALQKKTKASAAMDRCDGGFRVGRDVWRKRERPAVDRRRSRHAELLRRAGLWRQRHHVRRHSCSDHCGAALRAARSGRGAVRVRTLAPWPEIGEMRPRIDTAGSPR